MNQKKVTERYKQLRILITRAKEDSEKWGTNESPLLLRGIEETSAFDFHIYDNAYKKFIKHRMNTMGTNTRAEAETAETDKKKALASYMPHNTRIVAQLSRIADALERIADMLEDEIDKK